MRITFLCVSLASSNLRCEGQVNGFQQMAKACCGPASFPEQKKIFSRKLEGRDIPEDGNDLRERRRAMGEHEGSSMERKEHRHQRRSRHPPISSLGSCV